ncbi:AmiS/UreI family transporter [Vreelandella venusta]|uniref:Transporter n=1 Tax=Vreelandella venusta TaxID=44935 RepID=A0AAQ0CHZ4_9GAMM|nr:AmiS/UreI family transporter [Halomonas venusta]AZM95682.1 transporter [Halomonas venusta]NPT32165.1 transporter [Halomonas venusta]QRL04853.1 AmiS/UreI family transporter [Halomonas venusta]GEK51149.1 putative transporter protein AmiS [Halomonas venusta]
MMLGLTLLYVGAVLFVNGIWLLGRIGDREVSVINILVGALSFLVAVYLIFNDPGNSTAVSAGAFTFLFSFTYLWVGANQLLKVDGRGLGWFCLFVSITAAVVGINSVSSISWTFGFWNAINWFAWAVLWFGFFALLALAKNIKKSVAVYTLFCAIFTGWVPGVLILHGIIST